MKTKTCGKCGHQKDVTLFNKVNTSKDGYYCTCRECLKIYERKYRVLKNSLANGIYRHQVSHSKARNHNPPSYTREELKEWLFDQDLFHELYDRWVESDYDRWLRPSVDRLDDYKSYTFDNIQLMTWQENREKAMEDIKNGKNSKTSRAVLQYDLDGNFIKEWHSVSSAGRANKMSPSNISSACRDNIKQARGFIWRYKND